MKKVVKSTIIAVLLLCTLLSIACFAACGSDPTPEQPENPPQQEQPKDNNDDNADADNGINVILSDDGKTITGLKDKTVTDLVILSEYNGVKVTAVADEAFKDCRKLTSVTIPSGITSIGDSAFHGCSLLTTIMIPANVTSIGKKAFYSCSKLKTAVFKNTKGWYLTKDSTATKGDAVKVDDKDKNAERLTTYSESYWKRTVEQSED